MNAVGPVGEPVVVVVRRLTELVFEVLGFVMKAAPLGAFGAMACAIGKFGLSTLTSLGGLIALFYVTSILFVVVVLGGFIAAYVRLNIFQLFRYLKDEFILVLGTSTAEPALPGLMRKLTFMGADAPRSAWSSRPGTASTSTAPPSTSPWRRSTSPRPPTPR
ncbi:cation:dicarboxylate symporter family transporter [Pseudonocardia zijingensis]|uniref:cation:dicarboxylate symporter family transporter n=1 Tax=Pseudonocardia zijingensis TaxID=153376 RepID=UPI00360DEF4A